MGAIKRYFKGQFQSRMFLLQHEFVSDFYIGCFQKNRSLIPLLCIRTILFIGCLGILLTSIIMMGRMMGYGYWLIYLTHWGLLLITLTTGFGFAVSVKALLGGPIDATFDLPWYVKMYWVIYNTTVPIAFFITIFYWSFLTDVGQEYAIDKTLDVFIHGVNSIVMLVLVFSSRQPTNILHFHFPIILGLVYVVFSIIYYFSGGTDAYGNTAIYPMIDWSTPGSTMGMVVLAAVMIILMHMLVAVIAAVRDVLSRKYRKEKSLSISSDAYN